MYQKEFCIIALIVLILAATMVCIVSSILKYMNYMSKRADDRIARLLEAQRISEKEKVSDYVSDYFS